MLTGEFQHNLDPKGRLTLPAKFRQELGTSFYIGLSMEDCLFIRTEDSMKKWFATITEGRPVSEIDEIERYFYSHTMVVDADKQGRFVLPPNLREWVKLDKEVTIIGVGDRAEIWDTPTWTAYSNKQTGKDIREKMRALGI